MSKKPKPALSTLDRNHPVIPPAERRRVGWLFAGRVDELRAAMAVKS